MSENFSFSLPSVHLSEIEKLVQHYIESMLELHKKDEKIGIYIPDMGKIQHISINTKTLKNCANLAFQSIWSMIQPQDFQAQYRNIQNEFILLFCIHVLISQTNHYLQEHIRTEFPLYLSPEKAYQGCHLKNTKNYTSFLLIKDHFTVEERLYMLSTVTISKLQHVMAGWFIEFFSINKRYIRGLFQNKISGVPVKKTRSHHQRKVLDIKL